MNETLNTPRPEIQSGQRAFLLSQLAGPDTTQKSRGDLNKKIPAAARRQLQLTNEIADRIRQSLVDDGQLAISKKGRTTTFSITAAGRDFLTAHAVPSFSTKGKRAQSIDEDSISDELREAQKAFLLLQLFDSDEHTLTQAAANKLPKHLTLSLGLRAAVANYRRAKLAEQGFIKITRLGRSNQYSLEPDGVEYLLAGARQLEHAVIPVKGKTLNALVGAAREASFEKKAMPPTGDGKLRPSPGDLSNAVLAMFQELLREQYVHSGLVPIHEIRRHIATQFGPAAARHDVLDEVIMDLWRERRIGLEGISDLSGATEQQLSDSIQGVNTTLFYLEVPREQPVAP